MGKWRPAGLVAAAVVVLAAVAMWRARPAQPPPKRTFDGTVTIGLVTWPGYLPLIVAKQAGYFQEAGVDVAITQFDSLGELSDAYVAGKLLGRANITFDAVNERLSGMRHQAVVAIDYSNGADAIVAAPAVAALRDIKGRQVAFEAGTLEEFLLDWALRTEQLTLQDIQAVFANPEQAAKQLIEGQVEAAVTYEPFASQAVASGGHVIFSSAQAPGLIADVLTFRSDFIEAYPQTIAAIIQAYFRAVAFWKQHPDEAVAMVAKEYGQTSDDVARQLRGLRLIDLDGNQVAFARSGQAQSLSKHLGAVAEFLQRGGRGHLQPVEIDQMIEPRFIRALAATAQEHAQP